METDRRPEQSERPSGLGVAEAKRRFSELLDRVAGGERIIVSRHGRPAAALVPADPAVLAEAGPRRIKGLAALAGALAEWEDIDQSVEELYAARERSADRPPPDLE